MIKRNTIQSTLVLEAVNRLQCHATADEVYNEIVKDYPTISRGTVYRNLQRLCEMGRLRKREIPDGPDRFDHRCDDHYHVRCVAVSYTQLRWISRDMTAMARSSRPRRRTRSWQG